MRLDSIDRDRPLAPGKQTVLEGKRTGVFVVQHFRGLFRIPPVLGRENAGAEHIQKSMHLRLHARMKLPDRMMQPGGKLDRHVMLCRRDERGSDLVRGWKGIRRDTASPQLVTEVVRRTCGYAPRSV